jgi:hypothetical protein
LIKQGDPSEPTLQKWLIENLKEVDSIGTFFCLISIGIDPKLIPQFSFAQHEQKLKIKGIEMKSIDDNLIDQIWEGKKKIDSKGSK